MEPKVKAIVHDFNILSSSQGSAKIVLYLKHPQENKLTEHPLKHLIEVNYLLTGANLSSLKELIGKTVELTAISEKEIEWKSMA